MRSQTEWPAATSESHELLLAKLDTIWDELGEQKTNAFLLSGTTGVFMNVTRVGGKICRWRPVADANNGQRTPAPDDLVSNFVPQ